MNTKSVRDYILAPHHLGFFCYDLEQTVKFYTEVFGFEVLYYGDVEVANERLAMLKLGDMVIEPLWVPGTTREELYERAMQVDNHFAFMVSDIDAVKELLLKYPGIVFEEEEIRNVPNIGGRDLRVTFFRGLNGERVELMQKVSS